LGLYLISASLDPLGYTIPARLRGFTVCALRLEGRLGYRFSGCWIFGFLDYVSLPSFDTIDLGTFCHLPPACRCDPAPPQAVTPLPPPASCLGPPTSCVALPCLSFCRWVGFWSAWVPAVACLPACCHLLGASFVLPLPAGASAGPTSRYRSGWVTFCLHRSAGSAFLWVDTFCRLPLEGIRFCHRSLLGTCLLPAVHLLPRSATIPFFVRLPRHSPPF